jgi:hypothetical protein
MEDSAFALGADVWRWPGLPRPLPFDTDELPFLDDGLLHGANGDSGRAGPWCGEDAAMLLITRYDACSCALV